MNVSTTSPNQLTASKSTEKNGNSAKIVLTGNHTDSSFLKNAEQNQREHSNSYHLMSKDSREGHRYYIIFNCLYSTWTGIALLKHKSAQEVLNATKIIHHQQLGGNKAANDYIPNRQWIGIRQSRHERILFSTYIPSDMARILKIDI
jgi:hypothetical protein